SHLGGEHRRLVARANEHVARVAQLPQTHLHGSDDARFGSVLRSPFQRLLDQRLGGKPLLRRKLDERVARRNRRARDAALQPPAHRLSGERGGQEGRPGEDDPAHHRRAGRTMTIEFSRPKSSATRRSARWSGTQRSPSTTNMYSYAPVGSTTVARQTPS